MIVVFLRSKLGRYVMGALALVLGVLALRWHWIDVGAGKQLAKDRGAIQKVQADLATCQANSRALQSSIDRQNAANEVLQQVSDQKMAEASKALSEAQRGRSSAEATAAKLLAHPPAGIDACARMESADASVVENLK